MTDRPSIKGIVSLKYYTFIVVKKKKRTQGAFGGTTNVMEYLDQQDTSFGLKYVSKYIL